MPERPTIRVLIVDDEPLARQRLEDLLGAESDVQMPGKTGIDVVREVGPDAMPLTIFVTAYDRYALQAFDLAAVDYLVKPFDDERFEQAFQRARKYVELEEMGELRERLLAVLDGGSRSGAPSAPPAPASGGSPYLERIAV